MGSSPPLDEDTAAKVLRQVEFYFSDSNLPSDNFLLKSIEESDDGLVSLPLVCSFTRMRSHLKVKESDPTKIPVTAISAVAEVLRTSTFLRLSDDGLKVGRVAKLVQPETVQAEVDARSIAANPFPWNITMEEVETFFAQYSKVKSVRVPRHASVKGATSGFALVEFSSEEEAQKVLGMELTCQGAALELETKKAFDERKDVLMEQQAPTGGPQFQGHDRQRNGRGYRDGDVDGEDFTRGLIVSFTINKAARSEEVQTANDEEMAAKECADAKVEDLSREDIIGELTKFGIIRYVDYGKGETSGFLRFDEPEGAQKVRAAAIMAPEGGLSIGKHLLMFEALEGEPEKDYWKKLRQAQVQKRDSMSGGGRKNQNYRGNQDRGWGRGGRRGGRSGGRGRGPSDRDNTVAVKETEAVTSAQGKHKHFDEDDEEKAGNNSKTQKV